MPIDAALPLHPIFVHAPIVLIPLTLILVVPGLFSRRWFAWGAHASVVIAVLAAATAWGATVTGEQLADATVGEEAIARHAELGEMARNLAGLVAAFVVARWLLYSDRAPETFRRIGERVPALELITGILTAALCVAATIWVLLAGHSGGMAVWTS
ncbi:DUF2231 domain-containing protein [Falsarthrobacter nasiphocae]|uniref:Membrane protein n=1 Tax=Falsarthrobacter nasiphocae TaxID=189863 RepID=A0AAE3YJ38_9MICC|nr:DUF2231 domain-containing protein [Falsarthrobacter nasiphocae]MDR6892918.1 putative membrane protein [Falsarthrobacter nasiphocae]